MVVILGSSPLECTIQVPTVTQMCHQAANDCLVTAEDSASSRLRPSNALPRQHVLLKEQHYP